MKKTGLVFIQGGGGCLKDPPLLLKERGGVFLYRQRRENIKILVNAQFTLKIKILEQTLQVFIL